MFKKFLITLLLQVAALSAYAQDLNCNVSVNYARISTQDTKIFQDLQYALNNFMNGKKWAIPNITPAERINVTLIITLSQWDGSSSFVGTAQIMSSRPVYGTSYQTPVLNMMDQNWTFIYAQGETLEYNEASSDNTNLALLLAFYANIIVGLDFDTFTQEGGSLYFNKAQAIVNLAQSTPGYAGWASYDNNQRNRYWLAENLNNPMYKQVHETYYRYHRMGLDYFESNILKGSQELLGSLQLMERPFRDKPSAYIFQLFFTAKSDEICKVLQQADQQSQTKALATLKQLDPSNYTKYNAAATTPNQQNTGK